MTLQDEAELSEALISIHNAAFIARTAYRQARHVTNQYVDGYGTRTPGHGDITTSPTGEPSRPVETAVIAALGPDSQHHQLRTALLNAGKAARELTNQLTETLNTAGLNGRPKCSECPNRPTGLNNDRLKRNLCPTCYKRHQRAQQAAHNESTTP